MPGAAEQSAVMRLTWPARSRPVGEGAYVLHARRYLVDGGPIHPRQQQVIDDLAAFARPYLSRLWARLHGRDVWQEPCDDVDDVRALLEGVARSVSLDHRQRIKAMLELQVAG